jgi:hypothetical protein
MTTTSNKNIRFMENNFAELTSGQISYSSALSSFPFTNLINPFRSKVWKPSGNFLIDSTNNKIYINDGTNKTITLTSASYSTPALLATHIQTQLNASSTGWTVSYSTTAYKFTISNSSSVTLRLSQTTNATWNTIGFMTLVDLAGTSFVANQQRNHTHEFIIFDFGYNAPVEFFGLISPLGEIFSLSNSATIKLQANNLNEWTSPPLDITLTRSDYGIFRFMDDISDSSYRYWRVYIQDKLNPNGPEGLSFGHIYLGDYVTLTARNVANGFSKTQIDPSLKSQSEGGAIYFDNKVKYCEITGLGINLFTKEDRAQLEAIFDKVGVSKPLYVSIDPTVTHTNNLYELTKYATFSESPQFNHILRDLFSMSFSLAELQ